MSRLVGAPIAVAALLSVLFVFSLVGGIVGGGGSEPESVACRVDPSSSSIPTTSAATTAANQSGVTLTVEQTEDAIVIVAAAESLQMSTRDSAIGLMTAMQESGLRNLDHGDAAGPDSRGLFQQRPRFYPGVNVMDPADASRAFFTRLQRVLDRDSIPMWQAAQAVQHSADGRLYQKWEGFGVALARGLQAGSSEGGVTCTTAAPVPTSPPPGVPTLPASGDPRIDAARAWALEQLGTPYHFGGSCTDPHGPDVAGRCDCSSLMQQAYAHAGVAISRTTTEQVHIGREVSTSDLLPGDLLFVVGALGSGPDNPRHVGMYLGEGWLIQAPDEGDVVKLTPLRDWLPDVVHARRVLT